MAKRVKFRPRNLPVCLCASDKIDNVLTNRLLGPLIMVSLSLQCILSDCDFIQTPDLTIGGSTDHDRDWKVVPAQCSTI